ncbi:M-phase inducer phosphatase-like [Argiope bruennichi]|uniref:M-phase inducer phosphatase n=1 Tax=Argiope bruennichi TaxID=94029 RepID=A0A8T0G0V6_ARGBR|nr:M-phase inducer phosphatase-like [Argiope bruennichi]KAF8796612.1 M-phase inducer phosphatase like protein [Argiope bruennichi]
MEFNQSPFSEVVESSVLVDINKLSPVTNLALNLSTLSTSVAGTPIRRISWSNPVPGGDKIGVNFDDISPSMTDSPTLELLPKSKLAKHKDVINNQIALLSYAEEKENICPGSKSTNSQKNEVETETFMERCSQDSGYSGSSISHQWREKSFFSSFDVDGEDSMDVIFDFDNCENSQQNFPLPNNMSSLLRKPLVSQASRRLTPGNKKSKLAMRRCLSVEMDSVANQLVCGCENMSEPFTDKDTNDTALKVDDTCFYADLHGKSTFKRPEPPNDLDLNECKRRKSSPSIDLPLGLPNRNTKIKRSYSETAATIMHAILKSDLQPELIGDGSRIYALPLVKGRHQDLKSISPETLARLLQGDFKEAIDAFIVIDCRYPYEFEGGHIQGAKNIYTKEDILETLLKNSGKCAKNTIVIFHCEFSSERAPNLCRFLRKKDREMNQGNYPRLEYPELYILEGGYKAFYKDHKEFCEPQDYKPMNHKDHGFEMRHFRAKSKSWGSDSKNRGQLRSNSITSIL